MRPLRVLLVLWLASASALYADILVYTMNFTGRGQTAAQTLPLRGRGYDLYDTTSQRNVTIFLEDGPGRTTYLVGPEVEVQILSLAGNANESQTAVAGQRRGPAEGSWEIEFSLLSGPNESIPFPGNTVRSYPRRLTGTDRIMQARDQHKAQIYGALQISDVLHQRLTYTCNANQDTLTFAVARITRELRARNVQPKR